MGNNGSIRASDIKGEVPAEATHAKFKPKEGWIEKFYRINRYGVVQYYGERGGWWASETYPTVEAFSKDPRIISIDRSDEA